MDARPLTTLLIVTIALLMLVVSIWPSKLARSQQTAALSATRRIV
jgi:hypothetical protein